MSSSVSHFLDLKLTSGMDVPALNKVKILNSIQIGCMSPSSNFRHHYPYDSVNWICTCFLCWKNAPPCSLKKKGQHKEIWVPVASNIAVGVMSHDVTIIHQSSTPPMTSEASSFCSHGKGAVEDMTSLDNCHSGGCKSCPPREPFSSWLKDWCKKSRTPTSVLV